jgi:hypothetical protein
MKPLCEIILIAVCALGVARCKDESREFTGAAPLRDYGFFSYPRYHAPVGELPFAKQGTTVFHFSGIPTEQMWLVLRVPGYTLANSHNLTGLSTTISAELLDKSNHVICSATGSPSGPPEEQWILKSSDTEAAFWHVRFRDLVLSNGVDYSLHVTITNIDPNTPNVVLQASFEGGGNELP